MMTTTTFYLLFRRVLLCAWLLLGGSCAWAGLSVYTSWSALPPTSVANQRTVDFSTTTLASEQVAGKLTYASAAGASGFLTSGGSVAYNSTSSLAGFAGNVARLTSGTTSNATSVTITFTNATPFVGFLWGVQFNAENTMLVNLTLEDNSVVTLKNCGTASNVQCVAKYVSSNWFTNIYNALLGWILGDSVEYYPIYMQYEPDNGVKIKKVQFVVYNCAGCGFLSSNTSQDFKFDYLTYVDATAVPDHLEITTAGSSAAVNADTEFTITACGDAACTIKYINGVTGTLSSTLAATYPAGAAYSILAGPTNAKKVTVRFTATGTATIGMSAYAPTPSNTPKIFCGFGVAAASGNSCNLPVGGPHHLELSTGSATVQPGTDVDFTIKACADPACSVLYTGGVSGNLSITGVTASHTGGQGFSIGSGGSTVVKKASMTVGTATVSLSTVLPATSGVPGVYCGMGAAATSTGSCQLTVSNPLHHLELTTTGQALTCSPVVFTVKACADVGCSQLYTNGVSGTLGVSGPGMAVSYPAGQTFAIAANSSSTTIPARVTNDGTATAALSGFTVTPTTAPQVYCGMAGAAAASGGSCAFSVASSALLFDVPNHAADASQSVTLKAVKSSSDQTTCSPAFTGAKSVTFKCGYANPTAGTLPVRVAGVALNAANNASAACDGAGRAIGVTFDENGQAAVAVRYADVGKMLLTATTSGADISMAGSDSFTAAPASLGVSAPASITAGAQFAAAVTSLNMSGAATPNFGKETTSQAKVNLSWSRYQPTGVNAAAGTLSVNGVTAGSAAIPGQLTSFTDGAGSIDKLVWTEVGKLDLSAVLATPYLDSGMTPSGSTGATGALRFVPARFNVVVTPGCGDFTYSGQPFTATITALNALGAPTLNYDGTSGTNPNFARNVTLSTSVAGTWSNASVPASAFVGGVGSATTPSFTFPKKLTAAGSATVQATDVDGVSSTTGVPGVLALRSGRLKISNAFGSEKTVLKLPVQAQYWTGQAWILNDKDSCTQLPASAFALSNYRSSKGVASDNWTTTASTRTLASGLANVEFSAPVGKDASVQDLTGSVDIALNLGSVSPSADQSCLADHPSTHGAARPWLRSQYGTTGACASAFDRDPSARITFGVYSPESKRTIYAREAF